MKMKKIATFPISCVTALLLFAGTATAEARSWRVNSDATKHAHFADINAAMSSSEVLDGDTLYLDPGCTLTATQNVTKRVTVIGNGYLTDIAAFPCATISGALYLKSIGCKIESTQITSTTYLCANNITIERCKTSSVNYSGTAQYATIRQCYIPNGQIKGAGTADVRTIGWTIENCIIIYTDNFDPVLKLFSPIIRNNYVRPNYSKGSASLAYMTNAVATNNVFINTKFIQNANPYEMTDCVIRNNVMHVEELKDTYPDNIYITSNTEEAVFALEGTNDQLYTLKDGSPAIGAATDGGDCGPTGGLYPYVPSGFPFGMPHFQSSSISTRPQSGKVSVSQQVIIQNQ